MAPLGERTNRPAVTPLRTKKSHREAPSPTERGLSETTARESEEQAAARVHQRGAALEWMRVAGVEPVASEGVGGSVAVEVEVAVPHEDAEVEEDEALPRPWSAAENGVQVKLRRAQQELIENRALLHRVLREKQQLLARCHAHGREKEELETLRVDHAVIIGEMEELEVQLAETRGAAAAQVGARAQPIGRVEATAPARPTENPAQLPLLCAERERVEANDTPASCGASASSTPASSFSASGERTRWMPSEEGVIVRSTECGLKAFPLEALEWRAEHSRVGGLQHSAMLALEQQVEEGELKARFKVQAPLAPHALGTGACVPTTRGYVRSPRPSLLNRPPLPLH